MKGKTVLKDKVKIPNGLQPVVERQARHDSDRAGDLQFVDNPYAAGGPKFGYNFSTGRQQVSSSSTVSTEKATDIGQGTHQGLRGRRGNNVKRPYVKRATYSYNRFNRPYAKRHGSEPKPQIPTQMLLHPKPYFQFRNVKQTPIASGQKSYSTGNTAT